MMHKSKYILLFLFIVSYFSCTNAPDFTDEPQIEFVGFNATQIAQGLTTEIAFTLKIFFTDGDGDIGFALTNINAPTDVNIIDNRTGELYGQFRIPQVPEQGSNNGIQGEIELNLSSTCCVFPDMEIPPCSNPSEFPTNDLTLDVRIQDRAGNWSNTITTPSITLLCN